MPTAAAFEKASGWLARAVEAATWDGTVGIQSTQGRQSKKERDLKTGEITDGPATLAEVAAYNEFGTSTIPKRSFLRLTQDREGKRWTDNAASAVRKYVAEDGDAARLWSLLVMDPAKADVQETITRPASENGYEPLSQPYADRKARTNVRDAGDPEQMTLRNTGQLLNSIRYVAKAGGRTVTG